MASEYSCELSRGLQQRVLQNRPSDTCRIQEPIADGGEGLTMQDNPPENTADVNGLLGRVLSPDELVVKGDKILLVGGGRG